MVGDTEVVVVGAGPVGATAALLLAERGIPTAVIDRRDEPQSHPAAHVLSTRSLEIWRSLGLEREIRRLSAPLHELRTISYCTTLAGPGLGEVAVLDLPAEQVGAIESISPTRAAHLPQNKLEDLLWSRLRDHPLIEFRSGCLYLAHSDDTKCSTVTVNRNGTQNEIRTRYVIGADGASSAVRHRLGIGMTGPVLQHMVSVHFSADVERFYRNRRGPVLWTHTAKGVGTIIVHSPPEDLVFQIPYFPPIQTLWEFSPEVCARHIRDAIGDDSVEIAVKSVQSWAMTAQVADRYQTGNTFLIGDAAHRFPPTGGRGLNTGIADAHNLVWKLAWVLAGRAEATLLDTYEIERRPLGQSAAADSVRNFDGLLDVLSALGLPRGAVHALPNAIQRMPGQQTAGWTARLMKLMMALGYQRLRLAALRGPIGSRIRRRAAAAIALQGPHYRSWGADLGGIYRAGALVDDGSPTPAVDCEFYTPAAHVGGRIPHAWVEGTLGRDAIFDLIDPDRLTLFTGVASADGWRAVAPRSVTVVAIDDNRIVADLWGLDEAEALLVRPDHHIAGRLHLTDPDRLVIALDAIHPITSDRSDEEVRAWSRR